MVFTWKLFFFSCSMSLRSYPIATSYRVSVGSFSSRNWEAVWDWRARLGIEGFALIAESPPPKVRKLWREGSFRKDSACSLPGVPNLAALRVLDFPPVTSPICCTEALAVIPRPSGSKFSASSFSLFSLRYRSLVCCFSAINWAIKSSLSLAWEEFLITSS